MRRRSEHGEIARLGGRLGGGRCGDDDLWRQRYGGRGGHRTEIPRGSSLPRGAGDEQPRDGVCGRARPRPSALVRKRRIGMTDDERGRFFEDFTVGDVYRHAKGRTLSETDNTWFTLLTCNTNEIHFNADYAAQTEFGKPLMNSALTLALVTGLSVPDISRHIVANLGWDKVRLPAPVFAGDTIYAQSEVLETRPSKSRPGQGVVRAKTLGFKQDGTVVIEFERSVLVYSRESAPRHPTPSPR